MKDLIYRYFEHQISRRRFIQGLAAAGLSAAGVDSVFKAVDTPHGTTLRRRAK